MEYCSGGSCSDLVRVQPGYAYRWSDHFQQMKPGVIREEYIAIVMRELLKGLDYLHTEGKLHRDIKGRMETSYNEKGTHKLTAAASQPRISYSRRVGK